MALTIASAEAVQRGLSRTFRRTVQQARPFYPAVSLVAPSVGEDEKYAWLGDMPGMREWLGERLFHDLRASNYILPNKHWESSLLVKKTHIRDDRIGMYGPLITKLANEAAYHPDELFLDTLVAGTSQLCFDGQYYFDTDHAFGISGSQSNKLTYDVTTVAAPTAAEFKAAYNAAVVAMLGYKNDRGKLFNRPTIGRLSDIILLVPLSYRQVAHESMESTLIGQGGIAVPNLVIDAPRVVVSAGLTAQDTFYVFYTGDEMKPFVFQAREPLTTDVKGWDDAEFKEAKYMVEARYNLGYLAWWNAVQVQLI